MNYEMLSDIKRLIFETSIELFANSSFENVTINDIAHAINRTKSSIYNHFDSKQEILDMIYLFFREHFNDNRKTLEQIKPIIETGSVIDIVYSVFFVFGTSDQLMILIMRIVNQRKFFDDQARDIAQTVLVDEGIRYAQEVFDYAVKLGRLAPFDTYALALVCNDSRIAVYHKWILNPTIEYYQELQREHDQIYQYVVRLLTDNRCTKG